MTTNQTGKMGPEEKSKMLQQHLEERVLELEKTRKAILNILEDTAQSKEALVQSEARYRDLYDHAPVMFHTLDLKGNILECNEVLLHTMGYEKEKYIGRNIREFLAPEYGETVSKTLEEIIQKGKVEGIVQEYICQNGERLPIELTANIVTDEKGNPESIRAALVDITDRMVKERIEKRAYLESQLRSETFRLSMRQYDEIIEMSRVLQSLADIHLKILQVKGVVLFHKSVESDQFVNCAVATDDRIHRKIKEYIPSYARYMTFPIGDNRTLTEAMQGDEPIVLEGFKVFGRSEKLAAHDALFPECKNLLIPLKPFGSPWGLIGIIAKPGHIVFDLPESIRENLEAAIIRLEEWNTHILNRKEIDRLANFPQENPLPVVELDSQGDFTYINPATVSLLAKLGDKDVNISKILPDNYEQLARESLKNGKDIVPHEVELGDTVLLWSGHPIVNLGLVHFYATDITALKNTERELVKAKEQAETSDRLKNVFLSTMSHEVRTPLNVILGYTDLLALEIKDSVSEEEKSFFDAIHESGERLKQLIDDILDISQIEADQIFLKRQVFQADDLIKRSVKEIRVEAQKKNLQIVEKYNAPEACVKVDKVRLQQALGNILSNAVKFTHRGSITISTQITEDEYCVSVSDSGIGIRKDFKPFLFALFRQAEEGYDRSYEGAGLGLAISHRLVSAMGGRIEVKSQEGKGSRFFVYLPLVKEKEIRITQPVTSTTEAAGSIELPSKKYTVLVLEDNPANMRYIQFLLKKMGMNYLSAETGEKALKLIRKTTPDCMLIDISLAEGMSGVEFLEKVNAIKTFDHVPKIAVTAHAMKGKKEEFLKEGFNDYLPKPFTIKDLKYILGKNLK